MIAKAFKFGIAIIIVAALFFAVSAVLMINLLNPNQFKTQISALVQKNTGRTLNLNGDIQWSFFPWLGLKLHKVALSNPTGFDQNQNFIWIGVADVKVKVLPLFEGKVEINNLTLNGVNLNLITDSKGKNNWNNVVNTIEKEDAVITADPSTTPAPANAATISKKLPDIAISTIDIKDAVLNWNDQKSGQRTAIKIITGAAKNIKLKQAFPVQLRFDVLNKNPSILASVNLTTQAIIDPMAQNYILRHLIVKGALIDKKYPQGQLPFLVNTDLALDLERQLLLAPKIGLTVGDTVIQGQINGKQIIKSPLWSSRWFIDEVTYDGITVTHINTQINAKNKIITINPLTANLYQGKLAGSAVINADNPTIKITTTQNYSQIQVGDLLKDLNLNSNVQVTGTGNLKLNLETQGQNQTAYLQNLQGQAAVQITNGTIKNIDIGQQIVLAISHLFQKSEKNTEPDTMQTPFTSLTATIHINRGIASNNDLLLQSPALKVTGNGKANLVAQNIDYSLKATALGSPFGQDILDFQHQIGGNIPIKISGQLNHPKIGPDYSAVAVGTFKSKIQEQIEKHVGSNLSETIDSIKGLLGN